MEERAENGLKDSHGISVYDPVRQIVKIVTQFPKKGTPGLSWDWRQLGVVLWYLIYSNLLILYCSLLKLTLQYLALSVKPARKSDMGAAIEGFQAA